MAEVSLFTLIGILGCKICIFILNLLQLLILAGVLQDFKLVLLNVALQDYLQLFSGYFPAFYLPKFISPPLLSQ